LRSSLKNYGLALVAVVVAVLLRLALDPLMGDTLPLVTIFGAVAAAVWLGGYRVAIPIALIGYVACNYIFMEPRLGFAFTNVPNFVGLIAYLFTCSLIIVFGEAARVGKRRVTEQREVFRVRLRSIGDAVLTTDTEGLITYINQVAQSLSGWSHTEALAEADQRKNEFLATLAHELRNPLAPMSNMLEVVKRSGDDREVLKRAHDTIGRQLGQMVRLVDDLLDLNRITTIVSSCGGVRSNCP
jgi:signal transduction histidine kinase